MSGVSAFRRQKLYFVFDRFFDVDDSGSIDMKDFELAIERIGQEQNWINCDSKYTQTYEQLLQIWAALRPAAEGSISREEWIQLWFSEDEGGMRGDWQNKCMNFLFYLQDPLDKGRIEMDMFSTVCSNFFGIDPSDSCKAFAIISQNGQVTVSFDYYRGLWNEYFNSDDTSALGNFIFGKTSFPSAFSIPTIVISACRRFKSVQIERPPSYDVKCLAPPNACNCESDCNTLKLANTRAQIAPNF